MRKLAPRGLSWLAQVGTVSEEQKQAWWPKALNVLSVTFPIIIRINNVLQTSSLKASEAARSTASKPKGPRCACSSVSELTVRVVLISGSQRASLSQLFVKVSPYFKGKKISQPPQVIPFRFLEPLPLLSFSHLTSPPIKTHPNFNTSLHTMPFMNPSLIPFPTAPHPYINYVSSSGCSGNISNLFYEAHDTSPCIIIINVFNYQFNIFFI